MWCFHKLNVCAGRKPGRHSPGGFYELVTSFQLHYVRADSHRRSGFPREGSFPPVASPKEPVLLREPHTKRTRRDSGRYRSAGTQYRRRLRRPQQRAPHPCSSAGPAQASQCNRCHRLMSGLPRWRRCRRGRRSRMRRHVCHHPSNTVFQWCYRKCWERDARCCRRENCRSCGHQQESTQR